MFMHTYQYCFYLIDIKLFGAFLRVSLSLFLFLLVNCSITPKRKFAPSWNPLCSRASTSIDPTSSHVRFCDDKARKDFSENFSRRGIHLEHHVILSDFSNTDLPTIINSKGWESLCGILITCPSVIIQEFYLNMHGFDYSIPHFFTHVRGTRIAVTPDLISKVLHVPRVARLDYPGSDQLRNMSKDKLSSLFYETPSSWGDRQNTPCTSFAKGLRFLKMVMTFVLYPLSHDNSITKPRARILLSLIERITIDFPFHFILSLINVYSDTTIHNKLIFPSAITRIIRHFSISNLESNHFFVTGAIDAMNVRQSEAQLRPKQPRMETIDLVASTVPSSFAPSTSTVGGVTLEAILA